ncbi:MAG: hypothetical protein HC848_01070 [Limnobacter sp.]|nr:hypothetical protein [Limnobacter sp.]
MSTSVYGIALSGLNAARAGLSTTSNNISNVNTPGYNRQEVVQATRSSNFVGGVYIGQGVDVEQVRRVYSDFIAGQEQRATSDFSFYDAQYQQIQRLDGIIADSATGLSSAFSDFLPPPKC